MRASVFEIAHVRPCVRVCVVACVCVLACVCPCAWVCVGRDSLPEKGQAPRRHWWLLLLLPLLLRLCPRRHVAPQRVADCVHAAFNQAENLTSLHRADHRTMFRDHAKQNGCVCVCEGELCEVFASVGQALLCERRGNPFQKGRHRHAMRRAQDSKWLLPSKSRRSKRKWISFPKAFTLITLMTTSAPDSRMRATHPRQRVKSK